MASAFRSCYNLTSVPRHLLDACPSVSNVDCIFGWCHSLKSVPTDLFNNLRKIANFNYCFAYCYELTGESPYTMVGNRKVHLYERSSYPDYFVTPTYHDYSFAECRNLSDFDMVPSDWQ